MTNFEERMKGDIFNTANRWNSGRILWLLIKIKKVIKQNLRNTIFNATEREKLKDEQLQYRVTRKEIKEKVRGKDQDRVRYKQKKILGWIVYRYNILTTEGNIKK